jgi:uncharacterized membrane protein SpoIIM required for sporulation
MAELKLKSSRFRAEREADWRRLESLLARIEKGSLARLSPEELLEAPVLYRSALSSLSVARSISLDLGLIEYLEDLCTRAYFVVYGARASLGERIGRFFARDWPDAVKGMWRETLASFVVGAVSAAAAYLLTQHDSAWFQTFVPGAMASGRDPSATTAFLRSTLYDQGGDGLSVFATFLFTHNAQIAIFAFALGFALCLPTAALMAYNGASFGAFVALFAGRDLGFEAVGWLMIHGVTELFAVILAGAAGFSIGWAVAFPGGYTRMEAVRRAGRRAGVVMCGVVVMLFAAGLLEGFARQLIQSDLIRYAVATTTAVIWAGYFYLPRRRP